MENGSKCLVEREPLSRSERLDKLRRVERGAHGEWAVVFTAMRAGARGYILKDAEQEDVLRAIRAVGRGEAIFSPAIAAHLLDFFANPFPAVPKQVFPSLTDREREILHLIAQGATKAVEMISPYR